MNQVRTTAADRLAASASRTANASRRREEILAFAAQVFAAKGLSAATVRDIADEAGILSGSLYHHFESKDEMVLDVLLPFMQRSRERYTAIIESSADAADVMRRLIAAGLEMVAASPFAARILHNESAYFRATESMHVIDDGRQEGRRQWLAVVERGMVEGVFKADLDADVVVRAIFDSVYASTRWLPPRGTSSPERIATHLSHLFLDGLRAN